MSLFSRREALAVGATATAGLLGAPAAPVPKADSKSWVGKTVLSKRPDPVGIVPAGDADGVPVEAYRTLLCASWEVKAEKGTRVEVVEAGSACWVEKDQLVLLADADEFFTAALKTDPDPYAYNFRGWAKYLLGKPEAAVKDFDEFLKLMADAPRGHRVVGLSNRGLVLAETGKFDAAIKDLDEAVQLGHAPAQLNRGWAYELKGEYKKATADYAALLANNPDDVLALNNAAWVRATCPDAAFRDGKEAVKLATRVCELTGNRDGGCLDTLAAAHAEAGDFAAAVRAQEKALADPGYTRKYGDDAQKRLKLYKDKKPFRSEPVKAK